MATQTDREFLANVGGRTMDGQKPVDLAEGKPSLADKLLMAQEKAAEAAITMQTFGIGANHQSIPPAPAVSESPVLIKETLSMQRDALKSMADARKLTEQSLQQAETAKNEALTHLYAHQLTTIREAEGRARSTIEQAQGTTAPKSPFESYREIRELISGLREDLPKSQPSGLSPDMQIKLKSMELDQQRQLLAIQSESTRAQREWDIRMLEFTESSKRQWAEYQDKKQFREEGLAGLQDLVGSIGEGITKERGEPSISSIPDVEHEPQEEEIAISAKVVKFPCQFCQSPIMLPPGIARVICTNEQCKAEFEIDIGGQEAAEEVQEEQVHEIGDQL